MYMKKYHKVIQCLENCWPFEKKPTLDTIKDFQPDLVIAFNNSMPEGIADAVACPIVLWGADSFSFWNDKASLRKNVGRYHFFFYSERDVAECREFLKDSSAHISVVRNATAIRAVRQEKTYNLSFIGTNFALPVPVKRRCLTDSRELSRYIDHTMSAQERKNLHAGEIRRRLLMTVAPLGIRIFGSSWDDVALCSLDVARGIDRRAVYSMAHNQDIYNRSYIGISIAHTQAVTAYPWRILDVMASSAVLVSDTKADLVSDFGKKVPLQLYETSYEAYLRCQNLLEDPVLRAEVTQASQEAIDVGFRWSHRFKDIEQIVGVSLLNRGSSKARGLYTRLRPHTWLGDNLPFSKAVALEKVPSFLKKTSLLERASRGLEWIVRSLKQEKKE